MIKNYIKIAFRNLWRSKTFSFINIAGLSVGLACCMLIVLYTKDEVSYDRFHTNSSNIFRIVADEYDPNTKINNQLSVTGMLAGPAFKKSIPEIKEFVRLQHTSFTVKNEGDVFDQPATFVDPSFFSVFSFPLISGDPSKALNEINSVVLSEDIAEKYFGKSNAIGQTLELKVDGKFEPFKVSAVTKRFPQNSSIKLGMLLPMQLHEKLNHGFNWLWFSLNTFVLLQPQADTKKVESSIAKVYKAEAGDYVEKMKKEHGFNSTIEYKLQPLLNIHLSTTYSARSGLADASDPVYSYILSGIALFILVIACINFVNLTIARSLKRAKEIGIRKVVGGERRQLIAQFLGESFTLSLCAFLFAIVLVVTLLPFFNALSNKSLSFSYLLDTKLVLIYASLFIISSLLAGFYPALVLSGFNPVESLYGRKQFAGKNYLSKSLVIVQFVLATFLIIATLTIHSQFKHLTKMDLGYNDKNLAVISPGEMNANTLAVFKDELSKKPSIKSIAARFEGKWLTRAKVYQKEIITDVEIVDENYLQVFQVAITKGRNFSAEHPSDSTKSVLINETFAKEAGWKEPIGKQLDFNGSDEKGQHYTVVGVVKDYHFDAVNELIKPQLFSCNTSLSKYGELWLKIDPVNTPQTMSFIESTFKKLTPFKPYELNFRDELNAKNYEKEAKWKQIILFSTILTIFISCIGLFGLSMLAAEKRTKEIGIRKVLGASISSMVSLLSNDFLRLVIIAAIISIPLAWWAMNKWLENYPYRIEMNAGVFVLALILVLLVALLTICFQTIKAAIANPVKSLRTE